MLQEPHAASEEIGIRVNLARTQLMTYLVYSKNIAIDDKNIKPVSSYKCLDHDTKRRISLTWPTLGKMKNILRSAVQGVSREKSLTNASYL